MTKAELEKARAELISGISINQMIDDLAGKPYGQLVLDHLQKLGAKLPAGIAACVAIATSDETCASETIIDQFNLKGYDPLFWATDVGEILASVSCELNDSLWPGRAEEAGVFNLFQLLTQNFALMAHNQPELRAFIVDAMSKPAPRKAPEHGTITKNLGIAVSDCEAGRITNSRFISILQGAIDNGDILLEANKFYVVSAVLPLLDAGTLQPSKYTVEFEQRMNTELAELASKSRESQMSKSGSLEDIQRQKTNLAIGVIAIAIIAYLFFPRTNVHHQTIELAEGLNPSDVLAMDVYSPFDREVMLGRGDDLPEDLYGKPADSGSEGDGESWIEYLTEHGRIRQYTSIYNDRDMGMTMIQWAEIYPGKLYIADVVKGEFLVGIELGENDWRLSIDCRSPSWRSKRIMINLDGRVVTRIKETDW